MTPEVSTWPKCENCHALVPTGRGGTDTAGALICCAHCLFHPGGCRCKYGDFEEPQSILVDIG